MEFENYEDCEEKYENNENIIYLIKEIGDIKDLNGKYEKISNNQKDLTNQFSQISLTTTPNSKTDISEMDKNYKFEEEKNLVKGFKNLKMEEE